MTPFQRLGLTPDSDEREIKRAYARELKRCRPDDDPQGFQELNEVYQHCLAVAARRAAGNETEIGSDSDAEAAAGQEPDRDPDADARADHDPDAAPQSVPRPRPARRRPPADPAPQRLSFDLDLFLGQMLDIATRQLPHDLRRWLGESEPLYSLQLKHSLRAPVAHALAVCEPPPSCEMIDVVAECFDLGTVDAQDTRVRQWIGIAYDRAERSDAFERLLGEYRHAHARPVDRQLLAELRKPRSWPRRIWIAATPSLPGRLRELLLKLQRVGPEWLETRLNPESVGFWLRATDRSRLDPRRLAVGLARVPLYYLAVAGLFSLLLGMDPQPFERAGRNIAVLAAVWLGTALAGIGVLRVHRRLSQRGTDTAALFALLSLVACVPGSLCFPFWSACLAVAVGVGLIAVRGRDHAAPALACYLAAILAAVALLPAALRAHDAAPALVATGAAATLLAHDIALTKWYQVSFPQVRAGAGKLWRATAALLFAAFVTLLLP